MSGGLEPMRYADQVPCCWIAQADEECDADTMPEWVYDLLSPAQARHTSSQFRWGLMVRQTDLLTSVKSFLHLIAARTDPADRTKCFPSVARIAADLSCSERTVFNASRVAGRLGFVNIYQRRKGADRKDTSIYVLAWPEFYEGEVRRWDWEPERRPPATVSRPPATVSENVETDAAEVVTEVVSEVVTQGRPASLSACADASLRDLEDQGQETAGEDQGQDQPHDRPSTSEAAHDHPRRERPRVGRTGVAPGSGSPLYATCSKCGDQYGHDLWVPKTRPA